MMMVVGELRRLWMVPGGEVGGYLGLTLVWLGLLVGGISPTVLIDLIFLRY